MRTNAAQPVMHETIQPWYKHRWPWLLMLGPSVVVIAGIHTTWLAYTKQDALVVDDYYKQGKAINHDLRRDRVAVDMKLEMGLRYSAASGQLTGTIHSDGKPLTENVSIKLVHSTLPEKDVRLLARLDSQGHFSVALPMLDMARWQVLVESEQREWRLNGVWAWPEDKSIAIRAASVDG